ncbi:SH3 domain-containing protein [Agromyces aerolatus]|uniref:hypothetical protein n=1 Tax=Agromyces sp. LY-1074 TaxID=3074080 RepID=UPI002857CC52|nr:MULTISPECIES: hypothetical protein [unclassified Agromyces]MDR5700301.1 hypothetical protein [Agromyces sp. LY-1074]MDR5706721.1 hypothetical protein [Agromyces sp. LY-1358]
MHSFTHRVFIGLSVAAIGAGLFAAAPGYASASQPAGTPQIETQATSELRGVRYAVDLVGTPRTGAPALARLAEGERVTAFCGFAHDGQDWVKVQYSQQFGFVPADAVGGIGHLPGVCPNEIETIDHLAFALKFPATGGSAALDETACPASYPMLAKVDHPNHAFPIVPPGVRVTNFDAGIVAAVGHVTPVTIDGVRYAGGIKGGSVTSFGFGERLGQVWLTCTNNAQKAYRTF